MTNFAIKNVGKVCPPNQYAWNGGVLHCKIPAAKHLS